MASERFYKKGARGDAQVTLRNQKWGKMVSTNGISCRRQTARRRKGKESGTSEKAGKVKLFWSATAGAGTRDKCRTFDVRRLNRKDNWRRAGGLVRKRKKGCVRKRAN